MPILLLSTGDEAAKELLRQCITAHYGQNPKAFDAIYMNMRGRIPRSFGPFNVHLNLDLDIHFQLPNKLRLDYRVDFLRLSILKQSRAFDGLKSHEKTGNKQITETQDKEFLATIRERVWAYSTMLLIPLNEIHIELSYQDELCITAHNTQTGLTSTVCLYDDYQLKQIIVESADTAKTYEMRFSQDTLVEANVRIPSELDVYWDGELSHSLYPTHINLDEEFDGSIFQLN